MKRREDTSSSASVAPIRAAPGGRNPGQNIQVNYLEPPERGQNQEGPRGSQHLNEGTATTCKNM